MKTRIFRALVCLLVVCALIVNISPIRAKATAAGGAAIVKASTVTGNPYIIAGAAVVALGVMVGTETGAFETVVDNAVSYLETAGGWIEDGAMQLLKTVTDAGTTAYYVAGDLLETLRAWLFDSGVVSDSVVATNAYTIYNPLFSGDSTYSYSCDVPFAPCWGYYTYGGFEYVFELFVAKEQCTIKRAFIGGTSSSSTSITLSSQYGGYYYFGSSGLKSNYDMTDAGGIYLGEIVRNTYEEWSTQGISNYCEYAIKYLSDKFGFVSTPSTSQDLTLGNVSSVPIDGTSARIWAPDVANRNGLYVKNNNDPEPPDDNNGKWFWRLALPLTIAELLAMSQADEWSGETPEEFPEGSTVTEFEILDAPEIDGYQGIEIAPATNPDVNPDTGGGVDPTEPGEPTEPSEDESSGSDSETKWWEKIWKSIVELPNSFKTWFEDLKKGIDELPSKFQQWVTDIITAIQNLPQTFANLFNDIVTSVQTGIQSIKDFFTINAGDLALPVTWTDFFPFCIPSDIKAFVEVFEAEPEAPHFVFDVNFPYMNEPWHIDLDFSPWDSVALVLRRLELLFFIVGLAMATRNYYIRG